MLHREHWLFCALQMKQVLAHQSSHRSDLEQLGSVQPLHLPHNYSAACQRLSGRFDWKNFSRTNREYGSIIPFERNRSNLRHGPGIRVGAFSPRFSVRLSAGVPREDSNAPGAGALAREGTKKTVGALLGSGNSLEA